MINGTERRRAAREFRARWCSIRFDDEAIEIEVQERPAWRDRVEWKDITAAGLEPKGMLGPALYLFTDRDPGLVFASLDGTGGPQLHQEVQRRGIPFRPLDDLRRELDERLKRQARSLMEQQFSPAEWPLVETALASYRGDNAGRTHLAIVRLAGGQLRRVRELAAQARRDKYGAIVSRDITENTAR